MPAATSGEEGQETGPCLNNGCFGDLECLSNLCVDPDWKPNDGDDDDDEDEDEDDAEGEDDEAGDSDPTADDGPDTDGLTSGGSTDSGDSDPTDPTDAETSSDPTFDPTDPTDPTGDDGSESTGDPTGGGTSNYGDCNSCAGDEMPVAIEGIEGCFCSPVCDGKSCPAPTEGTADAVCALTFEAGGDPTQCALICDSSAQCPDGATCEDAGGASICMHPSP